MISVIGKKIKYSKNKIYLHINSKTHKNIINKFANKVGLVYFGYVNQHSDDHRIIRGLTVSTKHVDNNYCIGSVGEYNVAVVDRSDILSHPKESSKLYNWLIMSFDLHTNIPIPHFFIKANNIDDKPFKALFTSYPNMKKINLGTFEKYSSEFTSRFTIYARPAKSEDVEQLLDAKSSMTLGAHLWPFSVEQHDNTLYIYASNSKISISMMETMLENGLWLAGYLDSQSKQIND